MNSCGCHSGMNGKKLLEHIGCSPRHCTCAGEARDAAEAGWKALVDEVEIEDTLFEWAEADARG